MSSIIDMITAAVIFGVLTLTVARVQSNINVSSYQNQYNVIVQTNAVELARQIEWDFTKIGHRVTGQKIQLADSMEIRFVANLDNTTTTNTIRYDAGLAALCQETSNPRDFPLYRIQDGVTVKQNWGLTSFRISYYDEANVRIPTPITSAGELARIHSINVAFQLESPEPVVSQQDTAWAAASWEKTIVPRNLGNLTY
jgi:hypothetical protein